jgi:hypothetical protein
MQMGLSLTRNVVVILFIVFGGMLAHSGGVVAQQSQPVRPLPIPEHGPVLLWRDPGAVVSRDLFWGTGKAERAPQGPFTFVEEDKSGTQPKVVVTDPRGDTWDIKFGKEAHSEIAANRLVGALGYYVSEMYFVKNGVIKNATGLTRAAEYIGSDGAFTNGRFRRRDPKIQVTDYEWSFHRNKFVGSKELSGLRILMTMINNWDIDGSRNNKVIQVKMSDGSTEQWFAVSDLGATFGRMGGPISTHSKWKLEDYLAEGFIEKVKDEIHLDYDGWDSGLDRVSLEHARWFADLVGQLTPAQVRRAFEAAGGTPEEIDGFTKKFLEKIAALKMVCGTGSSQ